MSLMPPLWGTFSGIVVQHFGFVFRFFMFSIIWSGFLQVPFPSFPLSSITCTRAWPLEMLLRISSCICVCWRARHRRSRQHPKTICISPWWILKRIYLSLPPGGYSSLRELKISMIASSNNERHSNIVNDTKIWNTSKSILTFQKLALNSKYVS